jgi:excisionase family DNA binding protein
MGRKKSQPPPEMTLPSENGEELLSTRDLMRFLNLSRTKIWELVNHEGLPAFKIGGDYRYRKNEVVAWLEKYRVKKDEG